MKKLGIFGTSGFAREVADIGRELMYEPFFIARDEEELKSWEFPCEVILEKEINQLHGGEFTIGIGENAIREKVAKRYEGTINFINLIHPDASFGYKQRQQLESSHGVIVCAGARLTSNIKIGDFNIFNLNSTVGHDVVLENFVNLAPGAHVSGNVIIKEKCWIGTGAVINQGSINKKLIIGAGTVIGSGSVVINDCEKNAVYVGTPARRIR
ncbi:MAG: NeuD/PglB/VioB family sugar acetyltransferase [Marinospirillum sp.]|uniref:NeuD/PglB/VioB family sugar acetyltransferase n=1 Tax=Marinospirillum sp. TaxID=2183934 RepID=UPI001A0646BC|nr:NeuD/PglB/VioB family sugar acetyltransferase [Marinospirillum sp.]MBE0508203.1 NeuD/PglB/VioB family sugar acetyltransferase [Marinospirillum sp.]